MVILLISFSISIQGTFPTNKYIIAVQVGNVKLF